MSCIQKMERTVEMKIAPVLKSGLTRAVSKL